MHMRNICRSLKITMKTGKNTKNNKKADKWKEVKAKYG